MVAGTYIRDVRIDRLAAALTVLREAAFLVAAVLLYSLIRGMTDDRVAAAMRNADFVLAAQRWLGMEIEADLQRLTLTHAPVVVDVLSAVYMAYWPFVFGVLGWLLVRHHAQFPLYRNAVLISGGISLTLFAAFPLAPPRLLPGGQYVDTVAVASDTYRDFNASAMVNEYAAMPSLHFGWVLLLCLAIIELSRVPVIRTIAYAVPPLMFVTIVLTGNHYIVDGIVGGAVAMGAMAIARRIQPRSSEDDQLLQQR